MPRNRSPRPSIRSFLSNIFGISRSPSPRPPSRNNDSEHQLTAEDISAPPVIHAVLRPSITTVISTSVTSHERSVISPPSQIGHSYDTSIANDVPSALDLNRPPSSEVTPQFVLSAPQYYEEQHRIQQLLQPERTHISASITHQHMPPYLAKSDNQHFSVDPTHHAPYDDHHPTLRHPQVENVPQLVGTLFEQQYSMSQPPNHNLNEPPSRLQYGSSGMFYQAHGFVIKDSVFVDSNSDNFMASFLKETITGAEFDSSDPNMPSRCHPGTRLEIIKRCQDFVLNREGRSKIRWVVGAAGLGKSAIMQSVAHDESRVLADIIVGATIFFSVNGRQDGTKAITTIAYQLAVKLKVYRCFIQREVTDDPSLCQKSLSRQFDKFIVEPFIRQRILDGSSQLLIIIDGLDECANPSTQRELLGLIMDFCMTHPTSPIVWMIASRPEPHIISFFSQPNLALSYEKEGITVDSDEAYEDVKRYLRDKFRVVQMESTTLQQLPQWPSELDLLKIANASGGLFAYASTVVRYISDPDYGDPVPLLDNVLEIIETGANENIWGRNHPMAQLDALYSHIMSKIPANVMANTRKLLLCSGSVWHHYSFQVRCNLLGMTQSAAYGAIHHIRSIAIVPGPTGALKHSLAFVHKSFLDYLRDFERSGFSPDIDSAAEQLLDQCALRILEESPDGVYMDGASDDDLRNGSGAFKNGPGAGDNISVSWPAVEENDNREIRLTMFRGAVLEVMDGLSRGKEAFKDLLCVRVLTTCFTKLPFGFPFDDVRDLTFDESQRHELLEHGILKQLPLSSLEYGAMTPRCRVRLRFRGPTVEHSNPWNAICKHERKGSWEGQSQDWSTEFVYPGADRFNNSCRYCFERFIRHFGARSMEHLVTVVDFTPTLRLVELRFVDPDDAVSDWTYHFARGRDEFFHPHESIS